MQAIHRHERRRLAVGRHVSALWPQEGGDHAHGRLPVVLRVRGLQGGAASEGRRLLRVLLIRHAQVPADPGWPVVVLLASRRRHAAVAWRPARGAAFEAGAALVGLRIAPATRGRVPPCGSSTGDRRHRAWLRRFHGRDDRGAQAGGGLGRTRLGDNGGRAPGRSLPPVIAKLLTALPALPLPSCACSVQVREAVDG